MGRMYQAPIIVAAHTAVVDYIELLAGTAKPILIHAIDLAQLSEIGDAQEEWLRLDMYRVTGSPTSGSGGTTATITRTTTENDTASGATLETGNTTILTGGTLVHLGIIPFQVRTGYLFLPPEPMRIGIDAGHRFLLRENAAPTDSITGPVGTIWFEEQL